jgi:phosphoribosylaminoimidazole-succinocarboxamide synthase
MPSSLPPTLDRTSLSWIGPRYEGKVRDVYTADGRVVLIATDRISAFDHVLRQSIPHKGQVLNQLAAYFLEATSDVAPNYLQSTPDPNVSIGLHCTPVPVEFVVRGYLAGHAWRVYREGDRTLCGMPLPDGLKEGDPLPKPILTPATKAEEGHDEDISREELLAGGTLDEGTFEQLRTYALGLFARGTAMAQERGLLLVDTKYEFGHAPDGELRVIDEVHTPDSSRYYVAEGYDARQQAGEPQQQLSKEFVREWLMEQGFMGKAGQELPDMPDAFRKKVSERYVDLYERLTGRPFVPPPREQDPAERIEQVLRSVL